MPLFQDADSLCEGVQLSKSVSQSVKKSVRKSGSKAKCEVRGPNGRPVEKDRREALAVHFSMTLEERL